MGDKMTPQPKDQSINNTEHYQKKKAYFFCDLGSLI